MSSLTVMTFCKALRNLEGAYRVARTIIALFMRVGEGASVAERAAGKVLHSRAHADCSTHQIARIGHDQRPRHRYTYSLDTAPLRVADKQGGETWCLLSPSLPREESGLLRGRRGICLCRFIWEDCKGECYAFTRKAFATDTQEG